MEEDITSNAEFPDNGRFDLGNIPGSKYKVCGESTEQSDSQGSDCVSRPRFVIRGPGGPSGWGQPRPWAHDNITNDPQPGTSTALIRKKPKYDSFLKRTIPYVSLCTDSSGRNVCVDSIISNIYVRIPDDAVSTQAILSDVAAKTSTDERELTLVDSKFVPITDDDDKGMCKLIDSLFHYLMSLLCILIYVDLEYWKMPSRRFYATKMCDLEEINKTVRRKKLSLKRKGSRRGGQYVDLTAESDDTLQLERIEEMVKKVCVP